jgi:haloalkane dehalogenase
MARQPIGPGEGDEDRRPRQEPPHRGGDPRRSGAFETKEARRALLKAGTGLHPGGFKEIERWLPSADVPVRIVYGERDRILPDVAKTMRRVASDVSAPPEITALPDCGHFLQEERPAEVARILADFFR